MTFNAALPNLPLITIDSHTYVVNRNPSVTEGINLVISSTYVLIQGGRQWAECDVYYPIALNRLAVQADEETLVAARFVSLTAGLRVDPGCNR